MRSANPTAPLASLTIERPAPTVGLVIPTLNEEQNIAQLLPMVGGNVDELVIVDGRSTDRTIEVVQTMRPDARIVREERLGKGYALLAGFKACTSDIIVMMDADGSMTPSEIQVFVSALEAGADLVKGSRFLQGGGTGDITPVRLLGNAMLTYLVRASFGGRYSDLCYGYMAFWRDLLPLFDADVGGFEVETFLSVRALTAGLRVVEVASFEGRRISGVSNLRTMRDGLRVLGAIARERRRVQRYRKSTGPGHPQIVMHMPTPVVTPTRCAEVEPMPVGAAVTATADGVR